MPGIPCDAEGPVFREPWEAQAFAMALALHQRGLFTWPEWAATLGAEIKRAQAAGDPDTGETYYRHWLNALERLVAEKGVADAATLARYRDAWDHAADRTPHGTPDRAAPRRFPQGVRSVVITGVSSGIGRGCAETLCRRGYRVFGSVRNAARRRAFAGVAGRRPSRRSCSMSPTSQAVNRAARQVEESVGADGLVGLINNAGISRPGPLSVLPPEVVRQHFEVNVIGVLHAVQAFLPLLRRATGASSTSAR